MTIRDWQRCRYLARYGIHTGRKQVFSCEIHLIETVDDILADSQPGKVNVSGVLVFREWHGTNAPRQCDYRFHSGYQLPDNGGLPGMAPNRKVQETPVA